MSDAGQPDLISIYDSLWREGEAAFAPSAVGIDPNITNKEADRRRGISVVLRLDVAVRREMKEFVAEIRQLEPRQHYYACSEYHVTVLSLLACADDYEPRILMGMRVLWPRRRAGGAFLDSLRWRHGDGRCGDGPGFSG